QGVRQETPGRIKNCGMVETRAAGGRRRAAQALPGIEPQVMGIAAGRYEGRARPARGERKTQHPTVEIKSPLQVCNLQVDMADPHPGIDGWHLQGGFVYRLGLRHEVRPGSRVL